MKTMDRKVIVGTVERQTISHDMVKRSPITLGDVSVNDNQRKWLTDLLFKNFANRKVKITIEAID